MGAGWKERRRKKTFVANYFLDLFRTRGDQVSQQILNAVEAKVTEPMNDSLLKDFTADEVRRALDNIGDLKAPGPDGMSAIFYKKFWDIIGDQIVMEVLGVLNGGPVPSEWNETTIVLIPKVNRPELVKDLRPISLCNVLYKIVSKVLANRLKQILPEVISPAQSAFVPGRLISDNILVAYELTHFMKQKKKGKEGHAVVKLDMSKAYGRVEWPFLQAMMAKLGSEGAGLILL